MQELFSKNKIIFKFRYDFQKNYSANTCLPNPCLASIWGLFSQPQPHSFNVSCGNWNYFSQFILFFDGGRGEMLDSYHHKLCLFLQYVTEDITHSVYPAISAGETKFSESRWLEKISIFRERLLGKRGDFFRGSCSFYPKINKNLEYLAIKKFINKNVFLCHKLRT